MTREELEMRKLVRESDVIEKTDGSELANAFNHLWEKYVEQEPCEDVISRYEVIDLLKGNIEWMYKDCNVYSKLPEWKQKIIDINQGIISQINKSIKPITSQPKTGHWIQTNEFFINQDGQFIYKFICSECKSLSYYRKSNKKVIGANICPNCGAKMIDLQEREE